MRVALPTLRALLLEVAVAWATVGVVVHAWHPAVTALGMLVIATRQHALFILYHDAVHGLLARPRRLNDLLINLFVGVPQLLPIHVYRALHLTHHQHLGTDRDPERLLLYAGQPWRYRPLPLRALARQLLGDLLLWNNVVTGLLYARERSRPGSRLHLPPGPVWPEVYLLGCLYLAGWAAFVWHDPTSALHAAIAWFVPLVTLTQLIQKVRSFAEHAGDDAPERTYSWAPGLLGRLVLWPYHIQYHREHHERPDVPWYALPAAFPKRTARRGDTLVALLWDGTV